MLIKLIQTYSALGFISFLKYVLQSVLWKLGVSNTISYHSRPVTLRRQGSDFAIFNEVLVFEEYKYDKIAQPKWIVDAGANIGASAIYFALKYPSAKIIAIEPDPDNFKLLQLNTRGLENVILLKSGLWDKNESIVINTREGYDQCGNYTTEMKEGDDAALVIHGMKMDSILQTYHVDEVDILKIDIEGAEKRVFDDPDSTAWLRRVKLLTIETHDWLESGCSKALFGALKDLDFNVAFSGEKYVIEIQELEISE